MHAVCDNDPYRRLSWPALISATDGGLYRLPCHPPHIRATRAPFSLRLRDLWSGPHLSALTLKNAFVHFARQPRGRRRLPTCARAALPPQIVCTIIMITPHDKWGSTKRDAATTIMANKSLTEATVHLPIPEIACVHQSVRARADNGPQSHAAPMAG